MSTKSNMARGGQPGNQNARKHGFYSKARPVLDTGVRTLNQKDALSLAAAEDNLKSDIAALRLNIFSTIKRDPADPHLLACFSLLRRMLRASERIANRRRQKSREAAESLGRSLSITPETTHAQNEAS